MSDPEPSNTLSNKTYDRLKHLTQVVLPAVGSLYFGLGQIWDFPAGEEVVGTIALLTTFLGVSLKISSSNYDPTLDEETDGDIVAFPMDDGSTGIRLELNEDTPYLRHKQRLVFTVRDGDPE